MNFGHLHLAGFKCYREAEVPLEPGVTVVHGPNGSGKSTLLEACFFALYGTDGVDHTLEELVTLGAEESEIDLEFRHGGDEYRLRRRIRATGERATTAECTMETPTGQIDGVTDVEAEVRSLLRMDAEAFLNCAYVRQGEVNKLIEATPDQRQDMLDDLLQLGRLETYRERAREARLGVEDVLTAKRERLTALDEEITDLEDRDLHETRNAAITERNELDEKIERYEQNREEAQASLEEAEGTLEAVEERRDRLAELETEIEELEADLSEAERERERLGETLAEREEDLADATERASALADELDVEPNEDAVESALDAVEADLEDVQESLTEVTKDVQRHQSEAENAADRSSELADRADDRRATAEERDAEAEEATERATEQRSLLEELAEREETIRDRFSDVPVDPGAADDHRDRVASALDRARDRLAGRRSTLEAARERVAEAEALLEAGKCPRCGQPVDESPHVDALSDRRALVTDLERQCEAAVAAVETREAELEHAEELVEAAADLQRLEDRRNRVQERLAEAEAAVERRREQAETAREEAEDLEERAAAAAETAEQHRDAATNAREQVGELNGRKAELQDRRDRLADLAAAIDERETAADTIDRLEEKRAAIADHNDDRRDRLAELRTERNELREQTDESELEAARQKRERAEEYLSAVTEQLAELRAERDTIVGRISSLTDDIERLEDRRERHEELDNRVTALETVHGETDDLEAMYGDLRAELRRRNVARLEELLNRTFELVYRNDSYARVELSEAYELTVYQKDGEPLDPSQLSGGERALFNLSLRCAIYRLLAEGIEGAAPTPPLILDEPTVYLDAGHVGTLVDLIEYMRDEVGVEQIIVVSHDDELVGAADSLLRVEKDPTTNRSSVQRAERAPLVGD